MSNLIALLDNNNNIGLGTNHIGIGTTNSALPFKKTNNTILLDFDAITSKVKLGTVGVGTWEGTPIDVAYGGLGNIGTGTAGYVLKSNGNSLIWAAESGGGGGGGGGGGDITTSTNIATSASSNITIGTTSKELTINTSKLNMNLGSTNPSNGQVLKYNSTNATLEWGNLSATNLDNLWQLMKTFHPGYVFLLKSITVNDGSSNQSLVPSFNSNTINYTVNIGEILTVSILPTTFDSSTITQINNSSINVPNSYILLNTTNTFTIKNTYPNSSNNKIYTLNIDRTVFQDNNLDNIVIQPVGIGTAGDVNLLTNIDTTNTVYNVDVESNVKTISLTPTFHRTVTQLNIGNSSITTVNPEIIRIGIGTIGIGTAFIGIGTTIIQGTNNSVSNNSSIGIGTISSVYVSVKAENASLKNYEFKISQPPRTNTDLNSIEFIISDSNGNSTNHTLTNPQPGNHEGTDNGSDSPFHIENIYDKITINIIKSHFNQQVIINKNNLSSGVSGDIFNLTPFTQPVANGIIDTFNILNTPPIGVGTATYALIIKRKPSTEKKLSNIRITNTTTNLLLNSLLTFSDNTITDYTTGSNIIYTKETDIKVTCTKITSGQLVTYNSASEDSTTGTFDSVKTLALSPTTNNSSPVDNSIDITVTAEDNTNTLTYQFKVFSDNIAPSISVIRINNVTNKYKIKTYNNNNQTRYLINTPINSHIEEILSGAELNNSGTLPYNTGGYNQSNTFYNWYVRFLDNNELVIYSYENPSYVLNDQLMYKLNNNTHSGLVGSGNVTTLTSSPIIEYEHIQGNEYYLKIRNENTYLKVVERNSEWGYQDIDSIYWASITTPNDDYYKFTFELDTTVVGNTNNTTPSYIFNTDEAGTITSSLSLSSTNAVIGDNTITFSTLSEGQYSNKQITVTDAAGNVSNTLVIPYFKVDTTAPTLTQFTAISTPSNDTTPSFVFTTSKSGTLTTNITEGFSTSSSVTTGSNQTVTFKTLPSGTYSGKTITVTDLAGNANSLSIPEFKVDTTPPDFTGVTATSGNYTYGDSISITVTFDKNVNINNVSLILSNGATVDYTSGSGSKNIIFNYTIEQSDVYSSDLSVNSFTGSIKDIANNSFNGNVSGSLGGVIIYSPGLLDSTYNTNNLIGAYALDKLFTDYNGPTIQVINNDIYYNIYFNNKREIIGTFKKIDGSKTTDSIIGNNITKWYDQSNFNNDLEPGQYVGSSYNNYYTISNTGPELIVDNSNRFSYTTSYAVKFSKFTSANRSDSQSDWKTSTSDTLWVPNGLNGFSGNQSHTVICSHYSTLDPDIHYDTKPNADNLFSIGKQGGDENSESPVGTYNANECIAYHPNFVSKSYYYNYGNDAIIGPALESDISTYVANERLFFTLGAVYNNNPREYKIFKNGIGVSLSSSNTTSPLNIISQINSNVNFELGNFSQRNDHLDNSIASRFDGHIVNFMLYKTALSDSNIITISNKFTSLTAPSVTSISVTAGNYIYNYSNNIIDIIVTFNKSVNGNSASLNLSNTGSASYYSSSGTSITFRYIISSSNTNTDNLSVISFSGSITDLDGNNCSGISESLGGVNVIVLSSFGLSDIENQEYTLKLASYGNRALSAWYHTTITPAYSNLVACVVGSFSQFVDSIKWKLTNISIVGNDLIVDIESTEQTVRTSGSHNGDYFSVSKHSQNTSDFSNFNYPTHNAPSTIGGEDRIKLIKQSSGIFYIQHSNNSYLINKDVWEGGGVVDPVGWESGSPGNIGKWTFENY